MSGWRDHVLQHFAPQTSRLTLVADPDGLLIEEGLLNAIRARGFEVIPFDDPVAFRFAYESQYRQRWDRGEDTELVVVLRAEEDDLRSLPFDLLRAGRRLPTFRLAHIFPKLSNPVVQALDRSLLDALHDAYASYDGGELGDRSTKSFVLRTVFGCAPELVKTPADALRLLCEKHARSDRFPAQLDEHVVQVLRANVGLSSWPLEKVVPERDAFLHWLQDHWPAFVARLSGIDASQPSAADVPFHEVRAHVDTLFLDGALRPVPFENVEKLPEWAKVGVVVDAVGSAHRRLAALLERIVSDSPPTDASYKDWQQFAWRWAEVMVLKARLGTALETTLASQVDALHESVEARFGSWMLSRFGSLANLVERDGRPVMLHHVARYLAGRRAAAAEQRLALLVVDGLAIDQWLVIRDALATASPTLRMDESGVYAWVPTMTAVSRQTIFAGEIPLLFADSMGTTAKEEKHWRRVWEDADVPSVAIGYRRGLGAVGGPEIDDLIEHPKMQVLGLVINTVDDIMHGMMLGTVGMHQSVKLWAEQGCPITNLTADSHAPDARGRRALDGRTEMALWKRGRRWWTQTMINGFRIRQPLCPAGSTRATTKWQEAVQLEKDLIKAAIAGKLGMQQGPKSLFEACDKYLAAKEATANTTRVVEFDRERLEVVKRYLGDIRLSSIHRETIEGFQAKRRVDGASNRTVNMDVGVLRRVLKRFKHWHRLEDDVKMLTESGGAPIGRVLSETEQERLFEVAKGNPEWTHVYCAAVLAGNTSMRGVEIKHLRRRDIDLDANALHIRKSKNEGSKRILPLNEAALGAVKMMIERADELGHKDPDHYLWCANQHHTFDPTKPGRKWDTAWRALRNEAGLRGLRFHDLRHTVVTRLLEAGEPDHVVESITGHLSRRMLEHYSHIRLSAKKAALDRLGKRDQRGKSKP